MLAPKHRGSAEFSTHNILQFLVLKDNKLKTCPKQLTLSIINTVLVKKIWFHLTNPSPNS